MSQRIFTFCLLLFVGVTMLSARGLLITMSNDAQVYYSFDHYFPLIRFVDGKMQINAKRYAFSNIARFQIVEKDPTGLSPVPDEPSLVSNGEILCISGSEPLAVYNLSGQLQKVEVVTTDGCRYLSLASFPAGTYIIKVGTSSFKIAVHE